MKRWYLLFLLSFPAMAYIHAPDLEKLEACEDKGLAGYMAAVEVAKADNERVPTPKGDQVEYLDSSTLLAGNP